MDKYFRVRRTLAQASGPQLGEFIVGLEATPEPTDPAELASWRKMVDEERAKAARRALSPADQSKLAPYLKK